VHEHFDGILSDLRRRDDETDVQVRLIDVRDGTVVGAEFVAAESLEGELAVVSKIEERLLALDRVKEVFVVRPRGALFGQAWCIVDSPADGSEQAVFASLEDINGIRWRALFPTPAGRVVVRITGKSHQAVAQSARAIEGVLQNAHWMVRASALIGSRKEMRPTVREGLGLEAKTLRDLELECEVGARGKRFFWGDGWLFIRGGPSLPELERWPVRLEGSVRPLREVADLRATSVRTELERLGGKCATTVWVETKSHQADRAEKVKDAIANIELPSGVAVWVQ
jgi:hypothetical protein